MYGVSDYMNNMGNSGLNTDYSSWVDGSNPLSTFMGGSDANSGLSGLGQGANSATSGMSGLQMGQLGLGAVSGLLNGYLGLSSLSLAKSQAKQAQQNWNTQWAAQQKTTNASLSDRQAARVASNPNAYQSVDSYMSKYGI